MRKPMELQKSFFQEPAVDGVLYFDFTEDDFLIGKSPQSFPDTWEDEE